MTSTSCPTTADKIAQHYRSILSLLGENTDREGLLETPERVARMLFEVTSGLRSDPPKMTVFDKGKNDQMVTVLNIAFSSICEHHMVPFIGKAHIGYVPGESILGLSKFGRVLDWFASRPQIQENLTTEVADYIEDILAPQGVIVVIEAEHMCMSIRGIKKPGHKTTTSAIRGNVPKREFFDILKTS